MTRGGAPVAMVALALFLLPQVDAAEPDRPSAAPLATPAIVRGVEALDGVPVSLVIHNSGAEDHLLREKTPVAERVDLHHTRLNHGWREMFSAADGITIPVDTTMVFESGSDHLMLVGLQTNHVQGASFPLTLHFARAGEITVTVRVRRKVDAVGVTPIPSVVAGDVTVSLASAQPASVSILPSPVAP